jgi:hypothetical protein
MTNMALLDITALCICGEVNLYPLCLISNCIILSLLSRKVLSGLCRNT